MASPDIELIVIKPTAARHGEIADHLESVISGMGEVTIFHDPVQDDGPSMHTTIDPFDLMEARELSPKAQARFVRGILEHIDQSPCVVFRWLPPVPKQTPREIIKSML